MCCNSRGALSRLGVLWGLLAFATLLIAFISSSWLYTKEPVTLPNTQVTTSISFRIGLWRVCPSLKRVNNSIHTPSPACSLVKYSRWEDVAHTDLGVWEPLELAQVFITRMRPCTILTGAAVVLILLASFFALIGHCNSDNKTIIACGFFILGGLSLGMGLVVFASALSETLMEIMEYHKESTLASPIYDYRYGWCFFTAGAAFFMTKMAAVFSLTGYLNRFPSVDEMVREMVPGAERKLRDHQRLSSEFLVKHAGASPARRPYDSLAAERPAYEPECGPLLTKTPPDVCTTNKCAEFGDLAASALLEAPACPLAGQTIPITVKNHAAAYANLPCHKYGTIPHPSAALHHLQQHPQGFFGAPEPRSRTLQPQRNARKKCAKIETFQPPETGFADFGGGSGGGRRANTLSYSGSAV